MKFFCTCISSMTLFTGHNRISKAIEGMHDGGIFSLCVMKDGTVLSGGGKDRKIVQYDSSYTKTGVETEVVVSSHPRFHSQHHNFNPNISPNLS